MMIVWMAEYDMNMPINEVIAQFQMSADQRETLFPLILARYQPLIQRYYRQFYNLRFERSDFGQEMAVVVWQAAHRYDPTYKVTFGAYLSVRLYSRCLDLYRFHRHPKRYPTEGITALNLNADDSYPVKELLVEHTVDQPDYSYTVQKTMDHLYAKLSPLESDVLAHSMNGKTFSEIASHMLVSEKSVRYAYYRAHKKFRINTKDHLVDEY